MSTISIDHTLLESIGAGDGAKGSGTANGSTDAAFPEVWADGEKGSNNPSADCTTRR